MRRVHESVFIAIGEIILPIMLLRVSDVMAVYACSVIHVCSGLSMANADILSRWFFAVFMLFLVSGLCCCNDFNPRLGDYEVCLVYLY